VAQLPAAAGPKGVTPAQTIKLFNRRGPQKVDALIALRLADPAIDRDAKNLAILLNAARRTFVNRSKRHGSDFLPSLYKRYRGPSYPLEDRNGNPFPDWRYLSPWMKAQVATLCLHEQRFMQMQIHLHDDLRVELESGGVDLKEYLRDRLHRCLKDHLGMVPWFFFVIENRTASGLSLVRPHIHGSIQIPRVPLRLLKNGTPSVRYRVMSTRDGLGSAEFAYGREFVRDAIEAASGNAGDRLQVVNGVSQVRNVWCRKPYLPLFNTQWVDYSFKNTQRVSRSLTGNRMVMERGLNQEAQRLWRLIREGEDAMGQWGA
jgi:hypothetical protein